MFFTLFIGPLTGIFAGIYLYTKIKSYSDTYDFHDELLINCMMFGGCIGYCIDSLINKILPSYSGFKKSYNKKYMIATREELGHFGK